MVDKANQRVLCSTPEEETHILSKDRVNDEKEKEDHQESDRTGDYATIFDDVLKTIQEKMPELAVPLINETFGTDYPLDVEIIQRRDEYQTRRGKRYVDVHLQIGDKRYHMECQISVDGTMVIRMWEYDVAIALEHVEKRNGRYCVHFPASFVLQLRGTNKFDSMEMDIILADGQKFTYAVPVVWLSDFTREEIFQKHLLFLTPFYIMKYEKEQKKLEENPKYLDELLAEYREIAAWLELELLKNHETVYRNIVELIVRIADYVLRDSEKVRQEVDKVMGGKVLKLQTDYLIEEGEKLGVERINGLNRKLVEEGRFDDLNKSITDAAFQQALLKEYAI